jgi:hypothetical protein
MGDKEYQTFAGWKRAVKKQYPSATFRGDKDIGAAQFPKGVDVGEWDGVSGTIYKTNPDEIHIDIASHNVNAKKKREKNPSKKFISHTGINRDENDLLDYAVQSSVAGKIWSTNATFNHYTHAEKFARAYAKKYPSFMVRVIKF